VQNDEQVSRRVFLERLAAGALLGAAGACDRMALAQSGSGGWTPPPVLKNPNILIIMVDQMRPPMWMNSSQLAGLSGTLPNIVGRIQNNSYNFEQFYVSATACTASRAGLLTGLYSPQTAMYVNADSAAFPSLNPAFPTWGQAVTALNPAYKGNLWWFGKWHLNPQTGKQPLAQYGFSTGKYPGTSPDEDPTGMANEGTDGGTFNGGGVWASDAMIAEDFGNWLLGQQTYSGQPSSPWCATVSLINPHDICGAPAWFTLPTPPSGVPSEPVYFPPPVGSPNPPVPLFYPNGTPSPWNYENLSSVPNTPTLQVQYANYLNGYVGTVNSWQLYLNQYFWMQTLVDIQVGNVLNALQASAFNNNTIVIFLSDHGEYAGSHGCRLKGFGVYDESIRVPFCVRFPGQTGSISMNQTCSGVDFFGLICDLATGGSGQWRLAYPDLANRQSMWSFLYNNSTETRIAPAPVGIPYILHTFDAGPQFNKSHIVCLRTGAAKLAFYSDWNSCSVIPNSTPPDAEFYDYTTNSSEMGNDYQNPPYPATLSNHEQVLGSWGPPGSGLIGTELNAPLIGTGNDGNPLSEAQASAQQKYFNYFSGTGSCTGI
jgi:arylsulfatase A-like enzyme